MVQGNDNADLASNLIGCSRKQKKCIKTNVRVLGSAIKKDGKADPRVSNSCAKKAA